MAKESSQSATTVSPESYIGSFISLISKSEIRYEGVVFYINASDSTIGLQNVRSFGTERRRRDGPEVPPSDKVYEYIYFRGTDIKDLHVVSTPTVQSASTIHNDPAIIQTHYLPPTPASASPSLPPVVTGSVSSFSSDTGLVQLGSTFHGSVPQPLGSSFSPYMNGNNHAMPMYLQDFSGPSGRVFDMQQQALPQSPSGLVVFPSGLQQMQYSDMNASLPGGPPKLPEFPQILLQPLSHSSLTSIPDAISSPAWPSQLSNGGSAALASYTSPNQTENSGPTLPTVASISSLPLMSQLTCLDVESNALLNKIVDKPTIALGSKAPCQSVPTSDSSAVATVSSDHRECLITSSVTQGQLLLSGSPKSFSSDSLKASHKDVEMVKTSMSESLSTESKEVTMPDLVQKLPYGKKSTRAPSQSQHSNSRWHKQGGRNGLHGTALHARHATGNQAQGSEVHKPSRVVSHVNNATGVYVRGRGRGRGKQVHGAVTHTRFGHKGQAFNIKDGRNGSIVHSHYGSRGHGGGRVNKISPTVTRFTEDFDFVAMNEKFNKDEVWGQLGKSNRVRLKENANDSDQDDIAHEDSDGLSKAEHVYVKDKFFDSLSCNSLGHEPKRGMAKSEQLKLDSETFGDLRMNRGGRSGRGSGRGCWLRGSQHGRGYGSAGSIRGRVMRSRVT